MSNITGWCGRFGNNVQQISNGIFYALENGSKFHSPDNDLIKEFVVEFGPNNSPRALYFFHLNSKLGKGEPDYGRFGKEQIEKLYRTRRKICRKYIYPQLKINFDNVKTLDDDTVVLHIRSGDIFSRRDYYCSVVSSYLQNPLSYYERIINDFKKAIVITEDYENPIISELSKKENVEVIIDSADRSIEIILSAKFLVTPGVSSFSFACALLSPSLKKLYHSNIYLEEILNPLDLIETEIECEQIEIDLERYIKWNNWLNNDQQRKIMIDYVL